MIKPDYFKRSVATASILATTEFMLLSHHALANGPPTPPTNELPLGLEPWQLVCGGAVLTLALTGAICWEVIQDSNRKHKVRIEAGSREYNLAQTLLEMQLQGSLREGLLSDEEASNFREEFSINPHLIRVPDLEKNAGFSRDWMLTLKSIRHQPQYLPYLIAYMRQPGFNDVNLQKWAEWSSNLEQRQKSDNRITQLHDQVGNLNSRLEEIEDLLRNMATQF